jgi:uncharacterized phage protein gp47/JayE
MGGDSEDYIKWTLEVDGVSRAFVSPQEMGIGTVTVRFMMDDLRADNKGIPLASDVQIVADFLDTVRPVTVKDFFCVAPIPFPIDCYITSLVVDTPSVRAAIEVSLQKTFLARAIPGQTWYRAWSDEAIASAVGEDHHELIFATKVMPSPGHIAVLGNIVYAGA